MVAPKKSGRGARFGGWMAAQRKRLGLSQSQLGKAFGVDASYVSRLERGERRIPNAVALVRLADVLDVPLSRLMVAGGLVKRCRHPDHLDSAHAALQSWRSMQQVTEAARVADEIAAILQNNVTGLDPNIRHLIKPLKSHTETLRAELRVSVQPHPEGIL